MQLNLLVKATAFSVPLRDTHDTLRGFEIKNPNDYTMFFGCPNEDALPDKMEVEQRDFRH